MKFISFEEMDDLVRKNVTAVNGVDKKQFMTKENGFLMKQGSSNIQGVDLSIPKSGIGSYLDVSDGKKVAGVNVSEQACTSTNCLDDAGTTVEELTVRNNGSGNVEIGASSAKEKVHSPHITHHTLFTEKMKNLQNQHTENQNDTTNHSWCYEKQPVSYNHLESPNTIRTKILSQSGFSGYFVKNTLKGKGVNCSMPDPTSDVVVHVRGHVRGQTTQTHPKAALIDCNSAPHSGNEITVQPSSVHETSSLREWLKSGQNKVESSKSMYIFKQILDLVDSFHSRGEALLALRPSCFKLTPQNQILYVGSPNLSSNESGNLENNGDKKRESEHNLLAGASQSLKRRKHGENRNSVRRWPQFAANSDAKNSGYDNTYTIQGMPSSLVLSATSQMVSEFGGDALEEQWYRSPEDSTEKGATLPSNVYSLGVLLFELLGSFESPRAHAIAMMDLRQRILPPSYLSENPREAGFCLWLLHPEPSLRPTTRDILQSELISELQQSSMKKLSSTTSYEDTESDLMLQFLVSLKEQKQKGSMKLVEDIKCLEYDILEIESRRPNATSACSSHRGPQVINNINLLEQVYFLARSTIQNPSPNDTNESGGHGVLQSREHSISTNKIEAAKKPDILGTFFNALCKYARYSKFEVRGALRSGDFNSAGNVICSLGFDRDEEYLATAGVSKKIKVYEFRSLLDDSVDIHYPAVEMTNKSKLSSICWNSYIRNYLASTDYDGVIKIWDAGTGETVSQHNEHERRAWSVDFSRFDPVKFASGSDDCSVKLWSVNEKKSLATIKTVANVCCVQFSPYCPNLLCFGAADYRTYCYDLRNVSTPMCMLTGHARAVSYVKFLDCGTLLSASTDNTLKIWNLNKAKFGSLSTNSCMLTFKGHTNEKNFVGLSVNDGYIACGSETNEVFAYYRTLPMPITSHKFGSIDPISGTEIENDSNHFVSSVCWGQKSDMVVAGNSTGCLKVLQMV